MVSHFLISLMLHRPFFRSDCGKLLTRAIALKFIGQDLPQQVCIVCYIFGWYATSGLRCQMCLFHPLQCGDQSPLHWSNLMVCLFTLLSAAANQILITAKTNADESMYFLCFFRFALFSLSVLPFSTAAYLSP